MLGGFEALSEWSIYRAVYMQYNPGIPCHKHAIAYTVKKKEKKKKVEHDAYRSHSHKIIKIGSEVNNDAVPNGSGHSSIKR